MQIAKKPKNESVRLALLRELKILDTRAEKSYDEITRVAAKICNVPISLVSLVDDNRQWFKSHFGIETTESPRDHAFCPHAILNDGIFEVKDARKDERFADNPNVIGGPKVVFYAGFPLEIKDGLKVGTLCVIDHKPNKLNKNQKETLQCLGKQVINLLKLRLNSMQLEKMLHSKSSLFSNLSYEIRTPMNGIIGMTHILMDKISDTENLEKLKIIENCCDDLLNLLNSILDFTKIESGQVELENETFDLKFAIKNIVDSFKSKAKEKNIKMSSRLSKLPNFVRGDSARLSQIFINLINNAIKFSNDGKVQVSGKVEKNSSGKLMLKFSVKDDGIGIPKKDIHKLFKPFSQIDSSTTRKFTGPGIGLSVCKRIVELMGGKIWIESEVNKGSTLFFTVELEEAVNGHGKKNKLRGQSDKNISSQYPLKILLAEDNKINQIVATDMLEKIGYKVDIATNGFEVLSMLEQTKYDLILMDCQMPEMDGYEATREILKKFDTSNRPKIIALTATAMKEDKDKCLEVGMDDFLTKPMVKRDIIKAIKNLFEK